jgi:hypothetical protein
VIDPPRERSDCVRQARDQSRRVVVPARIGRHQNRCTIPWRTPALANVPLERHEPQFPQLIDCIDAHQDDVGSGIRLRTAGLDHELNLGCCAGGNIRAQRGKPVNDVSGLASDDSYPNVVR